jgi:threonylcarbamoyladenosine tRNA methylthiotransferase MtaB
VNRAVSFYTLGCRLNQAETALIAERFRARGYAVVEHGAPADVAVIHTCSVTEHADARCRQEIRKVRRKNPRAVVCAVGCYAQAEPEAVSAIESVDLVVGNDRKYDLTTLVNEFWEGEAPAEPRPNAAGESPSHKRSVGVYVSRRPDAADIDYPIAGYYPHQTRANIKIQDGCDFCCAFCILPRIRGEARSRRLGGIIAEGRELARRGHKELVITGVNVGTYQFEEFTIADVAWQLSEIPGVERIRISSIEPSTVSDQLLDWMANSPKACRHLHLPLQSGDDEILARMKRVYTAPEYSRFVEKAKTLMPDLGLGTDIMVGFPGENDRHFENSRRFVESLPFSYLHVFSYSDRPKTGSNFYDAKCHPSAIRERSAVMHDLATEKKRRFFDDLLGRTVEVLFESVDVDGMRKGFTRSYARVGVGQDDVGENECSSVLITSSVGEFCQGTLTNPPKSTERCHAEVCH